LGYVVSAPRSVASTQNKIPLPAVRFPERGEVIPAQAEIHGKVRCQPPVILYIGGIVISEIIGLGKVRSGVAAYAAKVIDAVRDCSRDRRQQQVCNAVEAAVRIWDVRILTVIVDDAPAAARLQDIPSDMVEMESHIELVLSEHLHQVVLELQSSICGSRALQSY
jgi:hypothetical protein